MISWRPAWIRRQQLLLGVAKAEDLAIVFNTELVPIALLPVRLPVADKVPSASNMCGH